MNKPVHAVPTTPYAWPGLIIYDRVAAVRRKVTYATLFAMKGERKYTVLMTDHAPRSADESACIFLTWRYP
jgi:hypothetical protein